MKTKITVTVVFLLFYISANAQKIRFCNQGNRWATYGQSGGGPTFEYMHFFTYGADTTLLGNTYKKIMDSAIGDFYGPYSIDSLYFVREDTITGIVYFRWPTRDSVEHVLYNYNLNSGDSISYTYLGFVQFTDSLVRIDSVLINGIYHKLFNFTSKDLTLFRSYQVLEGIGFLNGPFFSAVGDCFENYEFLTCFSQSGFFPSMPSKLDTLQSTFFPSCSEFYNFTNTCDKQISIDKTPYYNENTLFPNPANEQFTINFNAGLGNKSEISVYDLTGRLVFVSNIAAGQSKIVINSAIWHNGLYMIHIQSRNDNIDYSEWKKLVIIR